MDGECTIKHYKLRKEEVWDKNNPKYRCCCLHVMNGSWIMCFVIALVSCLQLAHVSIQYGLSQGCTLKNSCGIYHNAYGTSDVHRGVFITSFALILLEMISVSILFIGLWKEKPNLLLPFTVAESLILINLTCTVIFLFSGAALVEGFVLIFLRIFPAQLSIIVVGLCYRYLQHKSFYS